MSWRAPFIMQGVIAAMLAISCRFIPTSPRWLVLHNRRPEAMVEIEKLGIHREEAEKDILRVSESEQDRLESGFLESLLFPFAKAYRSRTILALFVLGMVQLSGIDGVLYVSAIKHNDYDYACALYTDKDCSTRLYSFNKPDYQSKQLASWPRVSAPF